MTSMNTTNKPLLRPVKLLRGTPGKTLIVWCLVLFIASIFLASLVYPQAGALSPKRVLLISSYHPGFPTFFEQINGIKSVFTKEGIHLDVEFMDSKRFAEKEHERLFHQQLTYKLTHTKPYDLVLSADDAALLYLLKTKNQLFPDQPLVFFGVNNIATAKAQNERKDITGVIEAVSMAQTVEMMLALQPHTTTILALVDNTPSSQGDLATFRQVAKNFPHLDFKALNLGEYTFADYAQELQSIGEATGVLLLSAYADTNGQRMTFSDSLHLILGNLSRPLFHLWNHGLGDGILGGKVISHYEQGKTAARMALRILHDIPPASIPVTATSPNISIVDYNVLKKYDISEKLLPKGVRILNSPVSLYQQHKKAVWLGSLFFVVQSGIIFLLILTLQKNRRTQLALVESETKYASLYNNNHSIFFLLNPRTGIIEDINPAACEFYGYPREELVGKEITLLNPMPLLQLKEKMAMAVAGQGNLFHFQHRLADGQLRDVEIHSGPIMIGGRQLLCSIVHDITERIQAERAVRERELFLDAILQTTADGFLVLDRNGFITETNGAYCAMLGYSKKELIGRHISSIDIHDTEQEVALHSSRIKGLKSECFVTDHQRKDGSTIPLEISVSYLNEKEGRFVSFCRDLSERKLADEKLQHALQQTHIITSNLQLGLLLVNTQDCIEFINQTFCDLTGIEETPDQIIGMSSEEFMQTISVAFDDPQAEITRIRKLIAQDTLVQNDELRLKNKRTILRDLVPIVIDGIPYGRLWYLNDITELREAIDARKQLEQQLVQAQKMEAIGTLAGGIAHDFNNILGAVIGYAEMAKNKAKPDSKIEYDLEMVLDAAQRATGLVRQILAFSRQGEAKPIKLKPAQSVEEALKLLRSTIPSTITIEPQIETEDLYTLADPVQLQQVVINLCTNAFHAMEKTGGRLRLALKGCTLTEADLRSQPQVQPGTFIRLTVADTGPGVPPLLLDKIFDPYFTTKETGRGTGMGLAIVHGIVTTIGGFITYDGIPGKGAIFHIYLPAVDGTSLAAQPVTISNIQGSGNILLVDDEEMLVEMGEEMLQMLGYNVTTCTNSRNALEIFQGTPDKFSAVITDQTMPEMTGSVLAQKILEIRPDLPIILCTGYSHIIDKSQAKSLGIQGFLMKPYSQQKLGALLKQVLTKEVNGPH
ncbi:PAS domain S-box protein [Desulfobulbus rhabdoformis]|uniref:hybrid sensor histidine kinase/response regulator n=1 Tax=Desulfobulbus rhabdoformis TaxID=34032 RepID=UPI0019668DA8|nr:ABC transporter substrate binding protein [Desulfobulbus rhabdoformis]MBM9614811.1 PAS domain S-box protein [Desulfobulbus rhabdoformis]